MKRLRTSLLAFAVVLFCCAGSLAAQSNCSYVIISTGSYTQAQMDQALSAAKLDAYRKKTLRREMFFANGAEVRLLSATELQNMNCPVNGTLAMEDSHVLDPSRLFEIHSSGVIIEYAPAVYKH